MIRFRRSKQDDSVIMQLIESQLVPLSHLSGNRLEEVKKDIPQRMRRGVTLVASPYYEEDPVGFVHFMIHGNMLFIDMLAIAPEMQRKGLGHTLMAHAEKFGASRGCTYSKVMVDAGNSKGLAFYQKLGYTILRHHAQNKCYELEKVF